MIKRNLFILSIIIVILFSGCEPVKSNGDDPDDGKRDSIYSQILINDTLPQEFEQGLTAEDWTTYFTVTDEDDGEITVTEDMLSWSPSYDYNTPGIYVLTCSYTNSLGNTTSESLQIEVTDGETPQEGTVGVEIIDNNMVNQFSINSPEPNWLEYFTIYNNGIEIETSLDMISFSPEINMSNEGEYVLTINYIDEIGEHYTHNKTIIVSDESQYDDIEAMTIYEILYQTYAFDTVRIDGLKVISVYDQKFIGCLNDEYILISNYGSLDSGIIESLNPDDIVNIVGDIHMSNGFSLNLEISIKDLQRVSMNNDPSTRTPSFIELSDVFNITDLEFLTSLRETVASYDNNSSQLGGLDIINTVDFDDNTEYLVEFVMVNHYEGCNPQIFVLSYEIYEDEDTPPTVLTYNPSWTYDNGQILSITVDVVSTNGNNILIGYINDYTSADANVVIIDTSETTFDWLVPSLIEGGRLSMTAEIVRTENSNDGYGFFLKPISDIIINAADIVYFGKTYNVGSVQSTTASEYEADLLYDIDFLGIMPIGDQGYVYEITATYDSTSNTIGGLLVSSLGAQLNTDGEYTIQFVVSKYYDANPYAEIIILNPYYEIPSIYVLNNDIGCIRNLIINTNNYVDTITAINSEGTITFTIEVPESMSSLLPDLSEGDVIQVIGQITSDGYTDTSLEVYAIQIEKTSE